MNTKAKGSRNERKGKDLLYSMGAYGVTKAGGSLGVFDLIAIMPGSILWCVQVKTNVWPGREEMMAIARFPQTDEHPEWPTDLDRVWKLVFMFGDREELPRVKLIRDGEEITCKIEQNVLVFESISDRKG